MCGVRLLPEVRSCCRPQYGHQSEMYCFTGHMDRHVQKVRYEGNSGWEVAPTQGVVVNMTHPAQEQNLEYANCECWEKYYVTGP